jgi:S-formylglutathione hydrolase
MGGHGALISFLKRPEQYRSVSAFAPITNVSKTEWGVNVFTKFFGDDQSHWKDNDACELMTSYQGRKPHTPVLIDQGTDDSFRNKSLFPERLVDACKKVSFPIEHREHEGYDHGYYFIMTFLEDHFKHHKKEFAHAK